MRGNLHPFFVLTGKGRFDTIWFGTSGNTYQGTSKARGGVLRIVSTDCEGWREKGLDMEKLTLRWWSKTSILKEIQTFMESERTVLIREKKWDKSCLRLTIIRETEDLLFFRVQRVGQLEDSWEGTFSIEFEQWLPIGEKRTFDTVKEAVTRLAQGIVCKTRQEIEGRVTEMTYELSMDYYLKHRLLDEAKVLERMSQHMSEEWSHSIRQASDELIYKLEMDRLLDRKDFEAARRLRFHYLTKQLRF